MKELTSLLVAKGIKERESKGIKETKKAQRTEFGIKTRKKARDKITQRK